MPFEGNQPGRFLTRFDMQRESPRYYQAVIFSSYDTVLGENILDSRLRVLQQAIQSLVPSSEPYLVCDKYTYPPALEDLFREAEGADIIIVVMFADTDNRLATIELLVPVFRNPDNICKVILAQHPRVPQHELIKRWIQDQGDGIRRVTFETLEELCINLSQAVLEKIHQL